VKKALWTLSRHFFRFWTRKWPELTQGLKPWHYW